MEVGRCFPLVGVATSRISTPDLSAAPTCHSSRDKLSQWCATDFPGSGLYTLTVDRYTPYCRQWGRPRASHTGMGRTANGDESIAVAYLRVSTEQRGQSALGLEAQAAAIERWAADHGVQLVAWHREQVSGGAAYEQRPVLLDALQSVRDHGAGWLVVQHRDRLARDVLTAQLVERDLRRAGARLATPSGGTADTPEVRLQSQMLDAIGEYERALISARTRRALAQRRAQGLQPAGGAPYGYRWRHGRLEPHGAEQDVLRQMRRLRDAGYSIREIAHELEASGAYTRHGRDRWHPKQVHRILQRAA